MAIPLKPLVLVKEMVNELGQDITYAYDDLVFVSHDHYLLRFTDRGEDLAMHVNSECTAEEAEPLFQALVAAGATRGITVTRHEDYTLTPNEADETLTLSFVPQA